MRRIHRTVPDEPEVQSEGTESVSPVTGTAGAQGRLQNVSTTWGESGGNQGVSGGLGGKRDVVQYRTVTGKNVRHRHGTMYYPDGFNPRLPLRKFPVFSPG